MSPNLGSEACADPFALDAAHHSGTQLAGYQGILTEILKIATT